MFGILVYKIKNKVLHVDRASSKECSDIEENRTKRIDMYRERALKKQPIFEDEGELPPPPQVFTK